jgi:hypothetical protein
MPVAEVETDYGAREEGSVSKLRTFSDALRILRTFVRLYRAIKPVHFYGYLAATLTVSALILGYPLLEQYLETHTVPRLPTAVHATELVLLASISGVAGLILDSVAAGRLEQKRLAYLRMPQLKRPVS